MKHYVKSAIDTLISLDFALDHEDRKLRTDRWIFTHANEPETRLILNYKMKEPAARTVIQRARQIVGLATSETGKVSHKARIKSREKAERDALRRQREAAQAAADARAAEQRARRLAEARRRQVSELDALMRGKSSGGGDANLNIAAEWITPERVADETGLTYTAVHRAIESGELTAYQVGKQVMVKPADARKWLTH